MEAPTPAKPIQQVAVGDKIALRIRRTWRVMTVARLTKTQFITSDGGRFRIDNGRPVGGNFFDRAVVVDDAFVEAVRAERARLNEEVELRNWIYNIGVKRDSIPVGTLAAMKVAFEKAQAQGDRNDVG